MSTIASTAQTASAAPAASGRPVNVGICSATARPTAAATAAIVLGQRKRHEPERDDPARVDVEHGARRQQRAEERGADRLGAEPRREGDRCGPEHAELHRASQQRPAQVAPRLHEPPERDPERPEHHPAGGGQRGGHDDAVALMPENAAHESGTRTGWASTPGASDLRGPAGTGAGAGAGTGAGVPERERANTRSGLHG